MIEIFEKIKEKIFFILVSEGSDIEIPCESHVVCALDHYCNIDYFCEPCSECTACEEGFDNTCGHCSMAPNCGGSKLYIYTIHPTYSCMVCISVLFL